jgi:hypothetical protein
MAYTATYTSGDLGPISIDIAGKFLAAFGEQAAILAVLIVVTILIGLVTTLLASIFGIIRIPFGK